MLIKPQLTIEMANGVFIFALQCNFEQKIVNYILIGFGNAQVLKLSNYQANFFANL